MQSKALILAALVAFTEARFGQEGLVQSAIQGLSTFGQPGQAATLAGQTPGVLLAGANACAKVSKVLGFCLHSRIKPADNRITKKKRKKEEGWY